MGATQVGIAWAEILQRRSPTKGFAIQVELCAAGYELDKVDQPFEAMLSGTAQRLAVEHNEARIDEDPDDSLRHFDLYEERRIGDPMRRRSFYLRIDHLSPQREAKAISAVSGFSTAAEAAPAAASAGAGASAHSGHRRNGFFSSLNLRPRMELGRREIFPGFELTLSGHREWPSYEF